MKFIAFILTLLMSVGSIASVNRSKLKLPHLPKINFQNQPTIAPLNKSSSVGTKIDLKQYKKNSGALRHLEDVADFEKVRSTVWFTTEGEAFVNPTIFEAYPDDEAHSQYQIVWHEPAGWKAQIVSKLDSLDFTEYSKISDNDKPVMIVP